MFEYQEPQSVEEMIARYAEVHTRCFNPSNAVEDHGINLARKVTQLNPIKPYKPKLLNFVQKRPAAVDRDQNEHCKNYLAHRHHIAMERVERLRYAVSIAEIHAILSDVEAVSLADVIRQTASAHGIGVSDIKSPSRRMVICDARDEYCARAYVETRHSLPSIGKTAGGRNHATILNSVRKMGVHHIRKQPETE